MPLHLHKRSKEQLSADENENMLEDVVNKNTIFTIIYKKYFDKIRNICMYKLYNEAEARDCAQEVFMIMLSKLEKNELSAFENLEKWLINTAENVVLNCRRYNKRRENISIDENDIQIPYYGSYDIEYPFSECITYEEYDFLNEYYIKRTPIEEIAEKFKISTHNVYKRQERLVQKLKKWRDLNEKNEDQEVLK